MKYEFDYQLRRFGDCIQSKQKSISYAKEALRHMREDRLRRGYTSASFRNAMFIHVGTFRKNAFYFHEQSKKHRAVLVNMYESAYIDAEAAKYNVA